LEREPTRERADLPFPVGVRALLPDDARRRRRIERLIVERLAAGGYDEVILPVLDFADAYSRVSGASTARESYRLIDREGELLTLRADFTPMAARAVAPRLASLGLPLRMFYRGDVVRCESARLGSNREYFQIGAELVGDDSPAADVEIVRLAVDACGVTGSRLTVSLGDASIARLALDEPESMLSRRLQDGTLDLAALTASDETAADARRLTELARGIEASGTRVVVTFDREDADGYYTGARFRIYAGSGTTPVAKGGRYDSLYACFGAPAPAVGFTLNVDALEAMR
jgi:ATP phosphoribosyltransferase regulatory subunit